jgi:hypothetical protein
MKTLNSLEYSTAVRNKIKLYNDYQKKINLCLYMISKHQRTIKSISDLARSYERLQTEVEHTNIEVFLREQRIKELS